MPKTYFRRTVLDLRDLKSTQETYKRLRASRNHINNSDSFLRGLRSRIISRYMRPMLRELREYPPRRKYPDDYPIEWTSLKQMRYVMGFVLKGKPYKRTGKLAAGWQYRVKIYKKSRISFHLKNDTDYSMFVKGRFGTGTSRRSIKRYIKPMQRFHMITGWQEAYDPVGKYIKRAKAYAIEETREWAHKII